MCRSVSHRASCCQCIAGDVRPCCSRQWLPSSRTVIRNFACFFHHRRCRLDSPIRDSIVVCCMIWGGLALLSMSFGIYLSRSVISPCVACTRRRKIEFTGLDGLGAATSAATSVELICQIGGFINRLLSTIVWIQVRFFLPP